MVLEDELEIVDLGSVFNKNLNIPSYQRPYRWTKKSANTLFMDVFTAFNNKVEEYRIGSVILHKPKDENDKDIYNIVDGQQRLTTLSIFLYCLDTQYQGLLDQEYSDLSNNAIIKNYHVLQKRTCELSESQKSDLKDYLLGRCSLVQIVTDSEQEAFQFFDSQNSRGKELSPHDLLKSFHLREMHNEEEANKVNLIQKWENLNQRDVADIFSNYLYPMLHWYRGRDGLGYSASKIDTFKGVLSNFTFNYGIYHKASHLYVEEFNQGGGLEILGGHKRNQFQLTQPVIAGKRFFFYTLHYKGLLEVLRGKIKEFCDMSEDGNTDLLPERLSGDIYVKRLFECSLIFFADRFGLESVSNSVLKQLYSWSYSIRIVMHSVYPQTINNYARGIHDRVNSGTNLFSIINEMNDPNELKLVELKQIESDRVNKKYRANYNLICKWNGWKNEQ